MEPSPLTKEELDQVARASRGSARYHLLIAVMNLVLGIIELSKADWHRAVGALLLLSVPFMVILWLRNRNPDRAPLVRALLDGVPISRVRTMMVGMGTESSQVFVSLGNGKQVQLMLQKKRDLEGLLEVLRRRAPQAVFE